MKLIALSLMLLWLVGCSHDMSTSPLSESESTDVAALSNAAATEDPIKDIEPPTPLCEVQQFGYFLLANPSNKPVHCVIGDVEVTVRPGKPTRIQLPCGLHSIEWWPSEDAFYAASEYVATCKTVNVAFDPAMACRFEQMK